MRYKSQLLADARGSIGGASFTRGKSGLSIKARRKPSDPRSAIQQKYRLAFKQAVARWSRNLTASNRLGWNNFAKDNPTTNIFGDKVNLSGFQWFCRVSINPRIVSGYVGQFDTPPNTQVRLACPATSGTFVLTGGSLNMNLMFQVAPVLADLIYIWISRPVPAGRTPAHAGYGIFNFSAVGAGTSGQVNQPFFLPDPFAASRATPSPVRVKWYWQSGTAISAIGSADLTSS